MANETKMNISSTKLSHNLLEMRRKELFTDVDIICQGETFRCHKGILCCNSLYFKHALTKSENKKLSGYDLDRTSIPIHNDIATHLEKAIEFMYSGIIILDIDNFANIVSLACYLGVVDLINVCIEYLTRHLDEGHVLTLCWKLNNLECVSVDPIIGSPNISDIKDKIWNIMEHRLPDSSQLQDSIFKASPDVINYLLERRFLRSLCKAKQVEIVENWLHCQHKDLDKEVLQKFIDLLNANPLSLTIADYATGADIKTTQANSDNTQATFEPVIKLIAIIKSHNMLMNQTNVISDNISTPCSSIDTQPIYECVNISKGTNKAETKVIKNEIEDEDRSNTVLIENPVVPKNIDSYIDSNVDIDLAKRDGYTENNKYNSVSDIVVENINASIDVDQEKTDAVCEESACLSILDHYDSDTEVDEVKIEMISNYTEESNLKKSFKTTENVVPESKFSAEHFISQAKPTTSITVTKDGKKQFKCSECDKVFTRKSGLQKHMFIHTGKTPYKCESCDLSFKFRYKLKWHVDRVHLGKAAGQYECGKCGFKYTDERNFEKHVVKCEGKKIVCKICSKKFIYKIELDRHVISHSDIRSHCCDKCPRRFKHAQNLKAHMLLKHEHIDKITNPSVCDHCGKVLKNRNCLRRHLLTHASVRPYQCTICPKSYTQSTGLDVHMRLHTGEKPFQCEICSEMFVIKCNLDRHIQRHLGDKPHKCTRCVKAFVQITDLKRHVTAVHLAVKSFPCRYCGKMFALKKSVPIHERSHTGYKPFECPTCKKSFITKSDMKRHELSHFKERRTKLNSFSPNVDIECATNDKNPSFPTSSKVSIANAPARTNTEGSQMIDRTSFHAQTYLPPPPLHTIVTPRTFLPPNSSQATSTYVSAFSSTGQGFY